MRMQKKRSLAMVVAVFLLAGCAGGGVSENKPLSEVVKEAETMTVAQLQGAVEKYKSAIESKAVDIEKVQAKLKEIPLTEMMGDEAKKIKDDLSAINDSVKALTERLSAYAQALEAKMKEQK